MRSVSCCSASLSACTVPGAGYVGGVYEPSGSDYGGWGPGYYVAPPRHGERRAGAVDSPRLSAGAPVPPGSADSDTAASGIECMREDEFDRCVTVLKLRATRERIREREMRCEGRKAFGGTPAEKKPLDRILELRRADARP